MAHLLGKRFKVEEYTEKLFSVELLRGSLFFSLSMVLEKVEPKLRVTANLGDWLVISRGRSYGSRGWVVKETHLKDVQLKTYDKRTVLIVEKISGEEEVPMNVQAIVVLSAQTGSHPDVLAHVSVRARNLKVMLACVFDEAKCKELQALEGRHIHLQTESSDVVKYEEQNPDRLVTRRGSSMLILQSAIENAQQIRTPPMFTDTVLSLAQFNPEQMGNKSMNI